MESRPLSPEKPHQGSVPGAGEGGSPHPVHVTTFTHEGRFWEVFLEFVEEPQDPDSCRARLRYVPTDRAEHEEPVRTAVIIIEPSRDEAVEAACALDRYHLTALLRSVT